MRLQRGTSRSGRSRTAAAGLLVAGSLVLAGCSGDDGAPDPGPTTPTQVDTDGDGTPDTPAPEPDGETGDDAQTGEGAPEPVAPPTEPADIQPDPGDRSASGDGDVTIEGSNASFVLPSGNLACTINSETAVCQLVEPGLTPQGGHMIGDTLGDCSASTADAMMLRPSGDGVWTCAGTSILSQATVASGGWWVDEVDGTTATVEDLTVAVLPYGESIAVGPVSCSSAEAGVTCRSTDLGRQFTLSTRSYNFGGL